MNRLIVMFVVFAVSVMAMPVVAAQEAWPHVCGHANDPQVRGDRVPACLSQPATAAEAAAKPAGLAQPAPASVPDQGWQSWWFDREGYAQDNLSRLAAAAAPKPVGLAQPARVSAPDQGWPGCPWGHAYDEVANGYVPACFTKPAASAAAVKPVGLAAPALAAASEHDSPCGVLATPIYAAGYVACVNANQTTSAAPKSAGLAAPAIATEQGWPGCPYGYDHNPACQSGPDAPSQAASKSAGLAQPAAAVAEETFVPCGFGERLDPLALACQQPVPAVNAAAKPAGLAQPAPATSEQQSVPCGPELASATVSGRLSCQ